MNKLEELRIGNKYRITAKLGEGSFGILFVGKNTKTEEEVAIKLEPIFTDKPSLSYESKLIQTFQKGGK